MRANVNFGEGSCGKVGDGHKNILNFVCPLSLGVNLRVELHFHDGKVQC
jgi:hypothetical protein